MHRAVMHRAVMSRALALLIASVLAATLLPVGAAVAAGISPFDDVSPSDPFLDPITWLDEQGITKGCNPPANDRFCPDRGVTRGQMAAFLARALGVRGRDGTSFSDIGESEFKADIERLATKGIVRGCNPPRNTRFCPDDPVTRGQMAAFLTRAFDLAEARSHGFTDIDESVFEADIAALAKSGITKGCNPPKNDRFCPHDVVTREQMAAFLYRAFGSPPVSTSFGDAGPRDFPRTKPSSSDIVVRPGDDVAKVVRQASEGATIRFKAGVYPMASIVPRNRQKLIAEPGVVLEGSRQLTNWSRDGDDWVVGGQTQGSSAPSQGDSWGRCESDSPGCVYPEGLFIDGRRIRRVTSRSAVRSGTWYFDYGGDRIFIGDDPAGRSVETSVVSWAIHGRADDVYVEGFEIVRYANPARQGVINPREGRAGSPGHDWKVVGNTVRDGHGWGIKVEHGMVATDNVLEGNGQGGFGGVADNLRIEHNEISGSCVVGIKCVGWEGGGMKLKTHHTTIAANVVHRNLGHGIHTDIGSADVLIAGNVVHANDGFGIDQEIGGTAVIRDNVVTDNGWEVEEPGIRILNSSNVLVSGNRVVDNWKGILIRQDSRTDRGRVDDVTVRGNTVILAPGTQTGIGSLEASIGSVRFEGNRYVVPGSISRPFTYDGQALSWDSWRRRGYDQDGSFERR